ncbi:RING finger domain protein [Penicillium brasilianum]|uniref:RING finger domain protein n=1 Tax=Penicillium brasilianum TaxID=104259 RepID=A0A1S9S1G0_PENBI|nr:RING finger domain protein [Penicillium brasilianum]
MSSNAGQNPTASKAVNISNTSAAPATFHSTAPTDNSFQRRAGGSGSLGAGLSARNLGAARNNQARKSQHKRQRKPRLLDDDEYSESAVMRSTNSRKGQTSITHLMNFSLPPRPQYQPPPRNARRYTSWGAGSGYHAVDKARYVHANYRFIVSPTQNYHAQAANADVHLDWASVLQVLVSAQTQAASCPICLSTPVAPRMARCGHIFCLPCLIRYMHASDDDNHHAPEKKPRWKKCPICWDSIYSSETRPVRWFRGQEGDLPIEGGDVVLRLVKREPGSTLALPRDGAETLNAGDDVPWFHVAEVADYSRIMKGGQDYMISQYEAEIEDLRRQEIEDELLFGDENTWTRKAISTINEAKEKVQGIGNPPDISRQSTANKPIRDPAAEPDASASGSSESMDPSGNGSSAASGTDIIQPPTDATSAQNTSDEAEHLSEAMGNVQINQKSLARSRQNGRGKEAQAHPSDQPYYFYQALPQFYLSPLDIRILKAAFGDYAHFPATILPRVEHISTGHMVDDELRKRVKYLGHLPYGCEVNFLECDWRDVVVPEVLGRFRSETEKRRKRNREKEAREEKDRIRAEKKEDEERWAAARRKRPSFGSASEAPFASHDFQPLANDAEPSQFDSGMSSASPPRTASQFGALASPSSSPPGARTVWGTTAIPSLSPILDAQPTIPNDGWLQGWEDELLARQESEIIAQTAHESQASGPSVLQGGSGSGGGGGGGKKKKKNKITLMSTNSHRGA